MKGIRDIIALTENGVDYLVEPKSIGKYELDTDNFVLTARKDDMDITINIDKNRKLYLALYPGDIEIDEQGNVINTSEDLTDVQKEHLDNLLADRGKRNSSDVGKRRTKSMLIENLLIKIYIRNRNRTDGSEN